MNTTVKTIAAVLGIGALLYWFNEKRAVKNIRVSLRGVKWTGSQLVLILQVINPSNISLTVQSVLGDLFYNGNQVATIVNFKPQGVAAGQFSNIEVAMQLSPMALLNIIPIIRQAKENGYKNINLAFDGQVRANNIVIPIKQTTQLA